MIARREQAQHRWPRLLALPVVLLCALAYLGGMAHFVLVQHRTCLEHGDLLHADTAAPGALLAQALSFEDERFTGAEAVEAGHGSDAHCAQALTRRELPAAVDVLSVRRVPPPEGPGLAPVREAVAPPVAWLHLAPKASPPRV